MARRVLDVTAYTTLDCVAAAARGPDWRDEGTGVLDVRVPADDPDGVVLDLELDPAEREHVAAHADSVSLTGDQARRLAAALEAAADREGGRSDRRRSQG